MTKRSGLIVILIAILVVIGAGAFYVYHGDTARLPEAASIGSSPQIPAPNHSLIPTVDVPPAKGWANGATPKAAQGFTVTAFATGLEHPRWLYVLPNGDVSGNGQSEH
jgi:hypothetical protein